ncbi:MAG: tRNA pseudouridine(38-40) synthase TruA [bacterium]|nr:tRNA pseudouridine(38-40) synthase TruA [bacterium]
MRLRAVLAYDGGPFHGFAPNPGVRTVGGDLADALSVCLRTPVEITCAGRTDKGVHARAQVVSFDVPASAITSDLSLGELQRSLNKMLGPAIAIREITQAHNSFSARFDAQSRTYRYSIVNDAVANPFLAATAWHYPQHLDVEAMNAAARHLLGTNDFASFCRLQHSRDGNEKSRVRHVLKAHWIQVQSNTSPIKDVNRFLQFEITASSFCQQMVRSITGTLTDIGTGRWPPDAMASILAAKDRSKANNLAPPQGLCLWEVTYPLLP